MYKKRNWLRPRFFAEYLDFPLEFREIGVKNVAVTSYVFCTQFHVPYLNFDKKLRSSSSRWSAVASTSTAVASTSTAMDSTSTVEDLASLALPLGY